jgi:polygalacturonase
MPGHLAGCGAAALLFADAPARAAVPDICAPPPPSTLVVNVKDQGAKGDGKTDNTKAIQAAIDAAAGTKNSTVLVPAGTYMVDVIRGLSGPKTT